MARPEDKSASSGETIRVLRVLEYFGPRDWVERTLDSGGVPKHGTYRVDEDGHRRIRSATFDAEVVS
jgi:hypothetical protein